MGATKHLLCVGGPMSGRRITPQDPRGFEAYERIPLPTPMLAADDCKPRECQPIARKIRYHCQTIGTVEVWAPGDQTYADTMAILLDTFERHSIEARNNRGQAARRHPL